MSGKTHHRYWLPLLLTIGFWVGFQNPSLLGQNSNFVANVTSGCSPLTVQFTDLSTGPLHSWFWDFGNGNTSQFDDVIATYTTPGTYTVSLTVTDTINGLSSTKTETAYITVFADPIADFSVDQTSGCAPLNVNFTDASTPGTGTLSDWLWDFGDGNLGNGAPMNHTYNSAGDFTITLVLTDDNGCSDTRIYNDLISVTNVATVDFSASPRTGCSAPLTINFTSTVSPAGSYTYLWDFGDGGSSTDPNPTYVYANNGDYTVSLTVSDVNGCQEQVQKVNYVLINQPVADFQALNLTACTNQQVQFENLSSGADSYLWNFGDGTTSTGTNPTHAYTSAGTYTVSLTATNSAGCSDFEGKSNYITVYVAPAPAFTSTTNIGCNNPLFVSFTDQSIGTITAWEWDFGNGNISFSPNPTTTYTNPGSYAVSLTVTTNDGCQSTESIPNYVLLAPPDAEFIVGNATGCVPLTTNFIDISSSAADPIVSWVWNFGDGNVSNQQHPSHTYTAAGQYTVTLTVTTQSGCQNTEIYQFVEAGTRPTVDFSANPLVVCVDEPLSFNDLTTGGATNWLWTFGDGGGSSQQNPSHTYADTGLYSVELVVSYLGCLDSLTKTDYIQVVGPVAGFTQSPAAGCNPPVDVAFFDQSHSGTSWYWDFGDGSSDSIQNPFHTYTTVGTYTVELTLTDSVTGCVSQAASTVDVTNPLASFSVDVRFGCAPLDVTFTNQAQNSTAFFWDFGDGNTSTAANPTHMYLEPGDYDVMFIASDGICADTLIQSPLVSVAGPAVNFGSDTASGCAPLTVRFSDSTTAYSGTTLTNWIWDFGDGNSGFGANPVHTYSTAGTYDVSLIVLDSQGCLDTLTKVAYITPTYPTAAFTTTDTLACPGSLVQFVNQSVGTGLSHMWDFGDGSTSSAINPTHLFPANGSYTISLTTTDLNGCVDTEIKLSFVSIGQPTASFVADTTTATCPPLAVGFTDQSSPDVVSWLWDFGDGSTSTLANPSKIYAVAGVYDVQLVVTNYVGCQDTLRMDNLIDISGPTGSFSFSPTVGCQPLTVFFTANSPDPLWIYEWDFGDGVGGLGTSVNHTYTVDTTAVPIMLVTDQFGCKVPISSPNDITIQPLPDVSFTVDYTEICLGQIANFTNTTTSERPVVQYTWDFGDGSSSSSNNPTHIYPDTGTYVVTLLAETLDGCTDVASTPIVITVTNPPSAAFSITPLEDCMPAPITFTDGSSGDFPITDWSWDFGDGTSDNGSAIPPHIYTNDGVYAASLTVTDNRGCTGSISRNITIHPLPPVDFDAFQFGCAPITVSFTDETLGISPNVSWLWDFGDGTTSTQEDPIHFFSTDGTYTVSLTVTDANGCVNTITKTDFIQLSHPAANFISNAGISCPPQTVQFTDLSIPDTTMSWSWDFGDGSPVSGQQHPLHTYYSSDTFDVRLIVTNIFGCADTLNRPQHVITHEPPNARFTVSDSSVCAPANIIFDGSTSTDAGGGSASTYLWDFGLGSGSSLASASFLYTTPGSYTVSLVAGDANGCLDTAYKTLTIHPNPVADFFADDTVGCSIASIQFRDASSGTNAPVSWQWTFGDGNSSGAQNPVNTYFADGTYDVSILVTDVNGCQDSLSRTNYIVLDHPTAAFSSNQSHTCIGSVVNFTDQSSGNFSAVSWQWTFGDGTTASTLQNPSHSYSAAGTYDVTLIITDALGCSDTLIQPTLVEVYTDPISDFAFAPQQGCSPLNVSFSETATDGSAPIVAYAWDFGDGGSSVIANPSYVYSAAGTYTITLEAIDQNGCRDSIQKQVNVLEIPTIDFIADQTRGCAVANIQFSDLSTSANTKVAWLWDFGDGTTSSLPNPLHAYTSDGTYTVSLRVTDVNGCVDSLTKANYIRLSHPVAEFTFDQAIVCPNEPIGVSFSDASTGDTTLQNWLWDFGDGTTSTSTNPNHSYINPGNYSISLEVIDVLGCRDTILKPTAIQVRTAPTPLFAQSDTNNCTPLNITFTDVSTPGDAAIGSWHWDFGNGDSSLLQHPAYTWTTAGSYTVTLTTTDLNGCQASLSSNIQAYELPVASFFTADTVGCAPDTAFFIDQSSSPNNIVGWSWDFGDGNSSSLANPAHVYASDGSYTVSLTITDQFGCSHTLSRNNYVRLTHPTADFTFSNSLACEGTSVQFSDASIPDHPLIAWLWDFGDGNTSTAQHPTHLYSTPGIYSVNLTITNMFGCTDNKTSTTTITVLQAGNAQMLPGDTADCVPFVIDFESVSTAGDAGLIAWEWSYGDGHSDIGANPVAHTFTDSGTYVVRLIVTDANNCKDTTTQTVEVYPLPITDFFATQTIFCPNELVQFVEQSTGLSPITSWNWDFGDGSTSAIQAPAHVYGSNGQYDVQLVIEDANGCRDSLLRSQYIEITTPQAGFSSDVVALCPGDLVQFTDTSVPDTTLSTWQWDFGDGSTSPLQNPTHIYTNSGQFTVRLIITNVLGCTDTLIQTNLIDVATRPTTQFSVSQASGCIPLSLQFTNTSLASTWPIATYSWDFGNGQQSNQQNPAVDYDIAGTYSVQLIATDQNGCTDTADTVVTVHPLPQVSFIALDSMGCAPQSVNFIPQSSGGMAPVTSYRWFFGDGDSSTVQFATHTYVTDGIFDVQLIVEDANGCVDTVSKPQYIQLNHPTAEFVVSQTQACPGTIVNFTDVSSGDTTINDWLWDFGDGTSGTGATVSHLYTTAGTFDIRLIISDVFGCSDTMLKPNLIEIFAPPSAQFTPSDSQGCAPLAITFSDNSVGHSSAIVSWLWDLGNGGISSVQHPSVFYSYPGTYTVQLTTTDLNGCVDSSSRSIEVFERPLANFFSTDSLGCEEFVRFFDLSSSPHTITGWLWDFGDGTTSTAQNPVHSYGGSGVYTVSMIAFDQWGCSDTLTKVNYINLTRPTAAFGQDLDVVCPETPVQFLDFSIPDHPLVGWLWDFGDGTTSTLQNPIHTYLTAGTYTVSLTVTNAFGCTDSEIGIIEVLFPPTARFAPLPSEGCAPLEVQYDELSEESTSPLIAWQWNFGTGASSTLQEPSYTFQNAGTYLTTLRVKDGNGCFHDTSMTITVHPEPIAAFTALPRIGCAPQQLDFVSQSQSLSPNTIANYFWDFGDGFTSMGSSVSHTYVSDGSYDVQLVVSDVNGCVDTLMKSAYVQLSRPQTDFSWTPNISCPGIDVQFTDTSVPDTTLIAWLWDFGDGMTSTQQHPVHAYSSSGTYTVSLTVTNILGCSETETKSSILTIGVPPIAAFSPGDTAFCVPANIQFLENITIGNANIASYSWDFGDGSSSSQPNPGHIFSTAGVFPVQLQVLDDNGCSDVATHTITVRPHPIPDFSASDSFGCAPMSISFLNQTSGSAPIASYLWEMGDGTSYNTAIVSHTYLVDGRYDVSLTLTDIHGCSDTRIKPSYIQLQHPQADFAMSQAETCPGIAVQFIDTSIPDTTISNWLWDFGDGTHSTLASPSHVYTSSGTYTVSLTITNIFGCQDTRTQTNVIQVLSSPSAQFSPSDLAGCAPLTVNFSNTSTPGSYPLSSWSWDFGNGQSSSFTNAVQTFVTPGGYAVQLIATDDFGCQDTISHTITVYHSPDAQFMASDSISCAPIGLQFLDQSTQGDAPINSWSWEFGDGSGSNQQFVNHTYAADGVYDVKLTVTDANGCQDSLHKNQYIRLSHPVADFSMTNNQVCPGTFLSFLDTSTPDTTLTNWLWDFGDGQSSTLQHPTHMYSTGGNYTVSLTITNVLGCSHTVNKTSVVDILPAPVATFTPTVLRDCHPFNAGFTDHSVGTSSPIVDWLWTFGDGDSSTAQNPVHLYGQSGTYTVSLTITDNNGCQASSSLDVESLPLPSAAFMSVDTLGCAPHTAQFSDLSTGAYPISSWNWTFGNGGTSSAQFPTTVYPDDGLFDVSLEITDINGCQDTLSRPEYIRLSNPQANFDLDMPLGCPGMEVHFTDISIPDTTLISWNWDFGDGNSSTVQHPSHVYLNPGQYTVGLTITNVKGCSKTASKVNAVSVSTLPIADIGADATIGCVPLTVSFTDLTQVVSSPIVDWNWSFATGDSSTLQEPVYTFTQAGTYAVLLEVTDGLGCTSSSVEQIIVNTGPSTLFAANDSLGCAPKLVQFTDYTNSSSPIVRWEWDFGDGTTSSLQHPAHTYLADGIYTVQLITEDANGCQDTLIRPQYIKLSHPQADFTPNTNTGCEGAVVLFSDESTSDTSLIGWYWDFGDGNISTEQHPAHVYSTPGTYSVELIVTNAHACRDTIAYPNLIQIFEGPNSLISATDTSGCEPMTVTLTNQSSSLYGLLNWQWTLDGVPAGQSLSVSRFFQSAGDHTFGLTVTDVNGCMDSTTQLIRVHATPQADFSISDSLGCGPILIHFNDLSSPVPVNWAWDFGDGSQSSEQHPIHTYAEDGIYSISLHITDQFGCSNQVEKINHIQLAHPDIDFSIDYELSCPPISATFIASGMGLSGIAKWEWDFGDGSRTVTTADTLIHDFSTDGVYDVVLIGTDSLGCSDTIQKAQIIEVLKNEVPDPIEIHAVSVLSDNQVEVRFAPYQNEYFQQYTIYREEGGNGFVPIHTTTYESDTIFIDPSVDALSNSYCYKITATNFCGTESDLMLTNHHCTIEARATAIPGQIILEWNPYIGWNRVDQYEIYKVDNYGTINASFVGIVPGNTTRFVETFDDCFTDISYRIRAIGETPLEISWSDTTMIISETGTVGRANQLVRTTVENNEDVLVEWKAFDLRGEAMIRVEKATGVGTFQTLATLPAGETSFRDEDVDVDLFSYTYQVSAQDSCGNTTPLSNVGKSILLKVTKEQGTTVLSWTPYEEWRFGVQGYQIEVKNDTLGQWEVVDVVQGNLLTYKDEITNLNQPYNCYRIRAIELGGNEAWSLSNEDCIRVETTIQGPNAFTPNGDDKNDIFYLSGFHVQTFNMKIYSRWGMLLFETNNIEEGWDGTYQGQPVKEGVYVYVARGVGFNGQAYVLRGSISLLR
ncbi:MAG: PKD domain-containing protein [Bacteroidota bacterium]